MSDKEDKKTMLEIKLAKKAKLAEEAKKLKREIDILEARKKKSDSYMQREIDFKLKLHTGGMVEMLGLHRYVYNDESIRDNPQDPLIANLLVGALQKVAFELETASVDELQELWECGDKFRHTYKKDRILPAVNPNLEGLIPLVAGMIKPFDKIKRSDNSEVKERIESGNANRISNTVDDDLENEEINE